MIQHLVAALVRRSRRGRAHRSEADHVRAARLGDAMATMQPFDRHILLLHRANGYSLQAIATELGLAPDEVEASLVRALTQLAGALDARASGGLTGRPPPAP